MKIKVEIEVDDVVCEAAVTDHHGNTQHLTAPMLEELMDQVKDEVINTEAAVSLADEENNSSTCRHCGRPIVNENGTWIDPEATGDDSIWRETCDANDTFEAYHEPAEVTEPRSEEAERQALANGFDSLTAAIRSGRCARHPGFMRDNCPGCGTAAQIGDSV